MNSGAAWREYGQGDLRDCSFSLLEEVTTSELFLTSKFILNTYISFFLLCLANCASS